MSKVVWVGVDVGKESFSAAMASREEEVADWAKLPVESFAFSEQGLKCFVRWVKSQVGGSDEVGGVCIESTGRLGWRFMEQLEGALGPVSMENPARTRSFGNSMGLRDKTDRVDACVLALYGVAMRPKATEMPPPVLRELRECNRLFSRLSVDKQSYKKRLEDGPSSALVRRELKQTIRLFERRMQKVQTHMDELIASEATLRRDVECITSVKGIGPRTAYVLLAELGDLRKYSRNEIASFAGLYPRRYESGTSVHKRPRLAGRGGGAIRKALLPMCDVRTRA